MIDRRHQGKGYGRAALVLAIDGDQGDPEGAQGLDQLHAGQCGRQGVLREPGFIEAGVDEDGEMIAELVL